jgi:hypothetical protein
MLCKKKRQKKKKDTHHWQWQCATSACGSAASRRRGPEHAESGGFIVNYGFFFHMKMGVFTYGMVFFFI